MCKYSYRCKQNHEIDDHCYFCHGHKNENCWYHCAKWNSLWGYHNGKYPNAESHPNELCHHIAENAHSLLDAYHKLCATCQKTTLHDRSRQFHDGYLVWKCSICGKNENQ
jgi:hypothetical protein